MDWYIVKGDLRVDWGRIKLSLGLIGVELDYLSGCVGEGDWIGELKKVTELIGVELHYL